MNRGKKRKQQHIKCVDLVELIKKRSRQSTNNSIDTKPSAKWSMKSLSRTSKCAFCSRRKYGPMLGRISCSTQSEPYPIWATDSIFGNIMAPMSLTSDSLLPNLEMFDQVVAAALAAGPHVRHSATDGPSGSKTMKRNERESEKNEKSGSTSEEGSQESEVVVVQQDSEEGVPEHSSDVEIIEIYDPELIDLEQSEEAEAEEPEGEAEQQEEPEEAEEEEEFEEYNHSDAEIIDDIFLPEALEVDDLNEVEAEESGESAADVDEEAGGDGPHNNTYIEVEITIQDGNAEGGEEDEDNAEADGEVDENDMAEEAEAAYDIEDPDGIEEPIGNEASDEI